MKKILFLSLTLILGMVSTVHSQVCGGSFTDPAGPSTNYANNSDYTVTISPTNLGEKVTVNFTSFFTEANFDVLYVYDGNSTSAPQISSANGAPNVPVSFPGGFWGNTIPGPFTSTSTDGCLTFRFISDGSVSNPGWIANVTCALPPTCSTPTAVLTNAITYNSATLAWTQPMNPDTSVATVWEYLLALTGSPSPTATTTASGSTSANSSFLPGLTPNTCYTVYVRAVCSGTDKSNWSIGSNFCTLFAPPICGGQFIDSGASGSYANNENISTTICPSNPGEVVTVTFTSFSTEATFDALYVFDGNSTGAPKISSGNPSGNVPGGITGGFWGSTIPGPFTSSSTDGCLTFLFKSGSSVTFSGWIANVSCASQPSCHKPTNLTINSINSTSAILEWTDSNSASSWEILAVPFGSATPSTTANGQIVTTNPATISGLSIGVRYSFYVRAICNNNEPSFWSTKVDGTTLIPNDDCSTALNVTVNGRVCAVSTPGSLTGATASLTVLSIPCIGVADDDAWFKFEATNATHTINLSTITGTTTNLNFAVYSGTCDSLNQIYCSAANSNIGLIRNLTVGTTYYLRVYSNTNTPQTVTFNVCITVPSTCEDSQSICGLTNYSNSTGVPSLGTIGCLFSSPNATYFTLKIAQSGDVNLLLTQSTIGSTFPNIDVDYAAWGPFNSQSEACAAIGSGQAPGIGVPVTVTTGCSFSTLPTEILNIANAQAGQYYIMLITNYSNQVGFINVSQSNANAVGAGSIDCSGIRLNAFIDSNTNGTQDSGEPNFPLGQFHYDINNGNSHSITSPSGTYMLYDYNPSNLYNLSYTINGDYTTQYSTPTGFTNVNVASGTMNTYNFPITVVQDYTDLGVTIAPLRSPRAGTTYTVKIVYTNNGTQPLAAGTLTFNNNVGTTITNISQVGTTVITNGFTYAFTDLLPYESRTILVTISVPAIPNVSLGQLLTNTVSVTPPSGDIVVNNNSNSTTQAVIGSYDPNDKLEGHGEKILFSSFTSNDYLEYTIRFENNGTAGALDILVNDVLDNKLDENTLIMLAASHNYTLDRLGNNLTWSFNNIQLPVAVPDTEIGKGYIKFKIKPKPGYAVGDIIPNTAEIFFDSNPAIVTNTFNTQFVAALGNALFTESSIILYPNPANNLIQIALQNTTEIIDNVSIYDVLGKKVCQISNVASTQSSIDVSNLSKGIYLVEISTESHLKQIKKLIIQ